MLVVLVLLVLVLSPKAEGAKATPYSLLEGVVIGFIGAGIVLVCPEQAV